METKEHVFEPLFKKAEQFSKTNFQLLKFKFVDKIADVGSTAASHLLLAVVLIFSVIALNVAIALWIGYLLGKSYYGFFIVSVFYAMVGIVLYFIRFKIKRHLQNTIINQLLN
jgi:hypothetical protein